MIAATLFLCIRIEAILRAYSTKPFEFCDGEAFMLTRRALVSGGNDACVSRSNRTHASPPKVCREIAPCTCHIRQQALSLIAPATCLLCIGRPLGAQSLVS
ncbi:hypothetical protein C8Q78DRAFT_1005611 [Trametes maxima]|nr:hypothetical protein C8Q78DRAFT_1005611 [Trametes maxima]